jgi:hypothetical protein
MKITKEQFKGIVREVMIDESEYQEFFKRALEKAGKSIPDMSDEEKKAFFNKIDAAWDAKGEKNEELTGNQHKLDVDGDGEIEASDLAALRAGKTNEAMASGAWVGIEKTPKGPKLVKTFKSGSEAKAWVMKSPGGHSIMTKKQWDVSEGKSEVGGVNEATEHFPSNLAKKIEVIIKKELGINKLKVGHSPLGGRFIGEEKYYFILPHPMHGDSPLYSNLIEVRRGPGYVDGDKKIEGTYHVLVQRTQNDTIEEKRYIKSEAEVLKIVSMFAKKHKKLLTYNGMAESKSVNEASKPTIKVVSKLKNEQGIQIVVVKTTKGETMYGGFVVRGKLQKVIPVGASNSKEGVQKRALQIWDEFGKQLGESETKYAVESVNESLIAKDGKILLNGKIVGYYDYDRGSAAFWTTDLSDTQFRGSQAFDTKEEMLAFFKKYLSRAAKALEYKRKALAKFGIKYPADESVNEAVKPTIKVVKLKR